MEQKKNLNRQLLKRIMFCASYEQYCKLVTAGLRTISRAAGNRRLAKKRVQWLNEALCFVSSSVLADSLVLRNPLLRQAPKR